MQLYRTDSKGQILPKGITFRKERFKAIVYVDGKARTKVLPTHEAAEAALQILIASNPGCRKAKVTKLNTSYRVHVTIHNEDGTTGQKCTDTHTFKRALIKLAEFQANYDTSDYRLSENRELVCG